MEPTHLENRFEHLWYANAPDIALSKQIKQIVPHKRYVYDFGVLPAKMLFEIQGGTYAKGRSGHSSGKGIARDADKVNRAQVQGFIIFVLPVDHLNQVYISELVDFCRTLL